MDSKTFFSYSYNRLLATLALALVVVALSSYALLTLRMADNVYTGEATITVSGEGEVLAKPDIGEFSFSVRAEGDDAVGAQDKSAESINAILKYLEDEDVEEKDIRTQNYNLNPKYRYEERVCARGSFCPPGDRVIDGYEVSQTVNVKVRDLDNAGALISGVGERGATNISSLRFTIDEEDVLKAEARALAIADAKEKAKVLARDLDMRLVRILGFFEDGGGYPRAYATAEASFGDDGIGGALPPSIPTGENTVKSNVTITYELR